MKKFLTVSDLTGQPIDDDSEVVTIAVLEHPLIEHPVQLDASTAEVKDLEGSSKDFVLLEVLSDGGDKRERLILELADFESMIKSGDPQEVLEGAERYGVPQRPVVQEEPKRRGRPRGSGGGAPSAAGPKVDYKDTEHFGLIHRGRITDEEKVMVAGDLDKANANRRREGQPEIDLSNPKDVEKYGLQAVADKQGVKLDPEFKG